MLGNYTFVGLAIWQGKIGLLYNFALARQDDLGRKQFILSRRSASSESSPFFKAILKVYFMELYWLLAIGSRLFLYWLLPPIGPIHCGVGSIGPIELPINRFGGRYVSNS